MLSKDWLHEHRKGREGDLEGDDKISRGTLRSQESPGVALSFCVVQYKNGVGRRGPHFLCCGGLGLTSGACTQLEGSGG